MDNAAKRSLMNALYVELSQFAGKHNSFHPLVSVQIVDTDPGPGGPYVQAVLVFSAPLPVDKDPAS